MILYSQICLSRETFRTIVLLTCILFSTNSIAQKGILPNERKVVKINVPKDKFHLYVLAGQSNMAGRGVVEPEDTLPNKRILRLNKNGEWEIAKEPIQFDKSFAGVGPGLSFAREILKHEDADVVIGLIPCAAGGSSMDVWLGNLYWDQTKNKPYENAIRRTRHATESGVLKGILWHQGEAEGGNGKKLECYKQKIDRLVIKIRTDLQCPNLPFVAGELPDFNANAKLFNAVLHEAALQENYFGIASGKHMKSNPDNIHMNTKSARKMGKRMAMQLIKIQKKLK